MKAIKREDLMTAAKTLGFDPRDVESVTIEPFKVRVILFERDEDGQKVRKVDDSPVRRVEVCDVI